MAGAAMGGTASLQQNPYQQASMAQQGALAGTASGMAYQPATLAQTSLDPYMNPYTNQVIGGLASDTGRAMQMGANQLGAQASAAGAFGGSRHGIAQGQMMGDALRNYQTQAGQLRQQGYTQAQQAAQQDIANQMSGQTMRMGAANQLANLGRQSFGYGQDINQQMMQQGALQQALQQSVMDRATQQYAGYQGAPQQALSMMTQAIGGTPYNQSTTQGAERNPGLFDYLTLGATYAGTR